MRLPLQFLCETGLLLWWDGKVGIPFRQTRGIDPHVEIRMGEGAQIKRCVQTRCSSLVRLVCRGTFWIASRGSSTALNFKRERGTSLETLQWEGPSFCNDGEPRGFLQLRWYSRITTANSGCLSCWPQGNCVSIRVARESWGLLSSHCRANRAHPGLCPETTCSSPVATGMSGLHSRFTRGVRPHLEWKQRTPESSRVARGIS